MAVGAVGLGFWGWFVCFLILFVILDCWRLPCIDFWMDLMFVLSFGVMIPGVGFFWLLAFLLLGLLWVLVSLGLLCTLEFLVFLHFWTCLLGWLL